jgi:putative toxin-antitoxin system antitoxin component (TIGR02293 family)
MRLSRKQEEQFISHPSRLERDDRLKLVDMIRDGFTVGAVERAAAAAEIDVGLLAELGVIPARTLAHSRRAGRFSAAQSDRVARFFRILGQAREVFADSRKAQSWLVRATTALDGRAPVDLLDTEEGARLVEDLLLRIDHGLGT